MEFLFFLGTSAFIRDESSRFVFILLVYTMLVTNLRFLFVYILQMTNRLKESSYVVSGDRLLYLLLLLVFIFVGFRDFKIMVYADLIGRVVLFFYAMYLIAEIWPCDLLYHV